jgi:hypothetical protein
MLAFALFLVLASNAHWFGDSSRDLTTFFAEAGVSNPLPVLRNLVHKSAVKLVSHYFVFTCTASIH